MSRCRRVLALVATGALALAACSSEPDTRATLPDVDLVPLSGSGSLSTADIDGPAVVNLWAAWCVACLTEMPEFEEVHERRPDVRFVGVNIGDSDKVAADFLAEVGVTYDQYLDPSGSLLSALKASTLPVTVVIDDSEHVILLKESGLSQAALEAALGAAG